MDALKNLSAPHARVIRNGIDQIVPAASLVVGDMIEPEAGDFVPADARLLQSASLKSEESALTGESVPSEKDAEGAIAENAPIGDRTNMVFSGCSITYGTATAIVLFTPVSTAFGLIRLPSKLYAILAGLIAVPHAVTEAAKLPGLIRQEHRHNAK